MYKVRRRVPPSRDDECFNAQDKKNMRNYPYLGCSLVPVQDAYLITVTIKAQRTASPRIPASATRSVLKRAAIILH